MEYRHCCVVDALGYYKTLVLVLIHSSAAEDESYTIEGYTLGDGEHLVNTHFPKMRQHAGDTGFIKPNWIGAYGISDDLVGEWTEQADEAEIALWEAEHPAPVVPEPEPEPGGELEERVAALEAAQASAWSEQAAAIREGVNSVE